MTATTSEHSTLDRLLDQLEHWMNQAEFGTAAQPLSATLQPIDPQG